MLMSSWRMDATAFVSLGGGEGMMWASFVGVWELLGSIGLSYLVKSQKLLSSDGEVWSIRLLISGVVATLVWSNVGSDV